VTPLALAPLVGLRLGSLVPQDAVSYGQVLVATPGDPLVTQGTVRGTTEIGHLGLELSVPWVVTAGEGLTDAGLGRVRGTVGAWIGRNRRVLLGIEGAAMPLTQADQTVVAWGTRARDTVPGAEVLLVGSWAHRSGQVGLRLAAGLNGSSYVTTGFLEVGPVGEVTALVQRALSDRWTLGGEIDLTVDTTYLTLRPMVRHVGERGLQADVGLQLPYPALSRTFTLQPFVQLRWRPPAPVSDP
jgi:hypothetical protein